mmetsp:Transcript_72875/g.236787  ORF Transcript_72875/g.236787 Transcript_72875/m.236787 type:complete len:267 (-) Transcript_72875:176-976(-)
MPTTRTPWRRSSQARATSTPWSSAPAPRQAASPAGPRRRAQRRHRLARRPSRGSCRFGRRCRCPISPSPPRRTGWRRLAAGATTRLSLTIRCRSSCPPWRRHLRIRVPRCSTRTGRPAPRCATEPGSRAASRAPALAAWRAPRATRAGRPRGAPWSTPWSPRRLRPPPCASPTTACRGRSPCTCPRPRRRSSASRPRAPRASSSSRGRRRRGRTRRSPCARNWTCSRRKPGHLRWPTSATSPAPHGPRARPAKPAELAERPMLPHF